MASGLLFTIGAQSVVAFPQGGYLINDTDSVSESKNTDDGKEASKKGSTANSTKTEKKSLVTSSKGSDGSSFTNESSDTNRAQGVGKRESITTSGNKVETRDSTSKVESVTQRIEALSRTMQGISDEIKALEISKKAIGGTVTPVAFDHKNTSHFYVGLGINYSFMGVKDKVKAPKRTLQWNEQKLDYYSLISTAFSFVKRDNEGNIMYDANGYPQYEIRENPMNDPAIRACYENVTTYADGSIQTGTLIPEKEAELKILLKQKVDALIGNAEDSNYQNSLMMVAFGAGGMGTNDEKHFRYSEIFIGDNNYGNDTETSFYFGTAPNPNTTVSYADGINDIANLKWENLIFTDKNQAVDIAGNKGQHVTFAQVLGSVVEQTFQGSSTLTAAGQKGMYTNLYSERYQDGGIDAFTKSVELAEINEHVKTHKPVFGGHIFGGWGGQSGKIYYGVEVEVGYSGAKANVTKSNKVYTTQTDFANGNIQYVDKDSVIKNPVTGKDFEDGKVYDENTGKVRPVHLSGLGRQTSATELELPDLSNAYDLDVKKSISFGITPMIGFTHMNTVYYASLGITYSRYEAKIKPNMEVLDAYANAIPVAYMKGYMENLKGSTFLHKYVKRSNGKGEFVTSDNVNESANSVTKYSMEAIYPASIIEQNSAGEENTFSGLRMNYPHYDDGGVSVVGENDSQTQAERPWLDDKLVSAATSTQNFKKFRFGFEPGIGFRTFISTKYFVDLRYSCQFSQKIKIKHDAFAAYPAHIGRSGMKHNLEVTGHKIRLSFGRII